MLPAVVTYTYTTILRCCPQKTRKVGKRMMESIKAYVDLTRLHFFFAWPTLFCSGLFLSFGAYGGFSWMAVLRAAAIGFLGFEAGLVLNDYVDQELDRRDVESDKLTKYWRLFKKRPIPAGLISSRSALALFLLLVASTSVLILTLPYPHSVYVLAIMVYCYCAEYFYQLKKRDQAFPVAQLLGRTDFSLFPVAGYLSNGSPDMTALLYFVFFYPFAEAHLGVNDMIDIANDQARGMKTVSVLYGMRGTAYWVLFFTVVHYVSATFFAKVLAPVSMIGIAVGSLLLAIANHVILKGKSAQAALKVLPLFHITMLVYSASIILGSVI